MRINFRQEESGESEGDAGRTKIGKYGFRIQSQKVKNDHSDVKNVGVQHVYNKVKLYYKVVKIIYTKQELGGGALCI